MKMPGFTAEVSLKMIGTYPQIARAFQAGGEAEIIPQMQVQCDWVEVCDRFGCRLICIPDAGPRRPL